MAVSENCPGAAGLTKPTVQPKPAPPVAVADNATVPFWKSPTAKLDACTVLLPPLKVMDTPKVSSGVKSINCREKSVSVAKADDVAATCVLAKPVIARVIGIRGP